MNCFKSVRASMDSNYFKRKISSEIEKVKRNTNIDSQSFLKNIQKYYLLNSDNSTIAKSLLNFLDSENKSFVHLLFGKTKKSIISDYENRTKIVSCCFGQCSSSQINRNLQMPSQHLVDLYIQLYLIAFNSLNGTKDMDLLHVLPIRI